MADTVLFAISFAPEVSFVKVLLRDLPNIVNDKKEWVTIQFMVFTPQNSNPSTHRNPWDPDPSSPDAVGGKNG